MDLDRAAMDAIEGRAPSNRSPRRGTVGGSFAAQVEAWALGVEGAVDAIFKEAAQELVAQMQALVPVDTGFLRASLVASTTAMPSLTREPPAGANVYPLDGGQIALVIETLEPGETLYLGYTASYSAYVHYGAGGRPPRPWVNMVAQRWQGIVAEKAAELKGRLGL